MRERGGLCVEKRSKGVCFKCRCDKELFEKVDDLYSNKLKAGHLILKNYFHMIRGPFEVAAVMDESNSLENNKCYAGTFTGRACADGIIRYI